jgi:hypothetical protein
MGCFDSLFAKARCPSCETEGLFEFQTKDGPCEMARYFVGDPIIRLSPGLDNGYLRTYFYCPNDDCDQSGHPHKPEVRYDAILHVRNHRFMGASFAPVGEDPPPHDLDGGDALRELAEDNRAMRKALKGILEAHRGLRTHEALRHDLDVFLKPFQHLSRE